MKIAGLQKLTLLDYPGKMAAIIFLAGCNFLCPFCHNRDLVLSHKSIPEITEEELFLFLNKRKGILDGVVISGGEPLLYDETKNLIQKIKALGYSIKLDTNGSFPDRLKEITESGLIDYVAMDIKNTKEKYSITIGKENFDITPVEKSVEILKNGNIPYEFRTTVCDELFDVDDFDKIGQWIKGCENYYIQCYKDSENVIKNGFSAPTKEKLESLKTAVSPYVSQVTIRGVE